MEVGTPLTQGHQGHCPPLPAQYCVLCIVLKLLTKMSFLSIPSPYLGLPSPSIEEAAVPGTMQMTHLHSTLHQQPEKQQLLQGQLPTLPVLEAEVAAAKPTSPSLCPLSP